MKQTLLIVICLVTLRSASQVQWIKTLGGSDTDLINDIATDNSGNVYMAGNFQDTIDFDPGPGTYTLWAGVAGSDAFLAKYNSAGALIWAKSFGDTIFFDQGERIAFDNSGHVYLTGYFRNHVDFDPGPGTTTLNSIFYSGTPSRDVFVSKFDTLGNFLWVRAVGGGTFDIARDVAVDQNGDVYVAGNFQWTADLDPTAGSYTATSSGKYDPFILKLSSSGTYLWARHFGGADQDQISAIDLDAAGNLYVVGTFEGTTDLDPGSGTFTVASNGNFDGFISKFNSSGNLIWAKRIGGANNDVIECIEIDSNCNLYLAGGFQNVVDFNMGSGTYTLNSQGTDVFINKIDSAGNFLWVKQLGNMNLSNARIWMFDRDAAGNIYTSGTFLNTVDLDPGPGTFTISTNLPGGQMFVCKHDVSGNFQWGAAYGRIISSTVTGGVPFGISADNLGNVYCGGWFKGDVDLDPSAATSTFTSPEGDMFFLKIGTNCLDAPSAPSVIYGPDHVCVGSTSHIYSVEPLPGAASYIWSLPSGWTGTSATNTILLNPSSSGVFSVAGSNACGTGSFSTYSININALPTLIVSSAQPMLCNAQTTTLTVNGASTYTWNDGTTANAIPIAPSITTVFTVTGTDVNGCVDSVTFTQQVYPLPTLSVSVSSPAICFGESATLQATGANNYTWTSFGRGASLSVSPLSTMVYTVNGTDANGCQNSATLGLIVNSLPVVSISSNDSVLCAGESSTLTAGGATSYTWSNNLTTTEITVTPAFTSTYSVTGIDINGCINSSAFTQSVSISNLSVSASDTVICVGETSTLSVNGAASYVWNPGGTGSAISVSPGANTVYTVTGTDLHGCINSATIGLDVNALPSLSVIASSTVICSGESATLSSVGAITYSWSSGGQGADITVSPSISSAYTVTGSDANACANSATLLLTVNALPTISATAQNATICAGGSATLTASGATTYSWSSGGVGMSAVVSPVSTFSYVVSGTDLNGCTNNATVAVNVNPLPTLNILPSATAICIGQSATLTATGASTYTWNPGGFGSSITVSPNQLTTYTVTGTDGNVCVNSVSFVLTVNTLPTVSLAPSHTAICLGESATLTAGGATAYSWSSGGSGISTVVSPGATTAYTVIGTDNNLCTNNATVEIIVNPLPAINILASNATLCIGQNATLTASGGSTYSWSPAGSAGSVVVSPITTSIYTVTGSDNNACSATATLQIVINSLPNVNAITNSTAICAGNTATLTANGALTYTWNPGGTGSVIAVSPTQSTNYTVTGTDANTCINETTLALAVNQLPIITAFASTTLICAGQSLSLWAAGASAYTWNPGATSISTIVVSPLTPITYSVEGADNNNCKNFATIGIVVNPSPIIFVASSDSSICAGENVILSAGGAVTYTWNSAVSGQSISVSPVVSTTYTVAGTDVNSCLGSAIFLQQVSTCSGYTSEFLQEKMLIFPNPTSGKLYLQNLTDTDDLQIFNSIGQRVLQPMEIKVSLGVIEVDLTHQANGIYFLKTETGVWKIIKQ